MENMGRQKDRGKGSGNRGNYRKGRSKSRLGNIEDSGASFHATPHRKHFLDYVQGDFGQVHLGDDAPCKIVGMGKVKIKQSNGNQWLLKEVRHVPYLRKNLISIGSWQVKVVYPYLQIRCGRSPKDHW
jgi:hypothetical protein